MAETHSRGVVVGLTWAVGWGLVALLVMGTFGDPHGRIADIGPMVLGIPLRVPGPAPRRHGGRH